MAYQEKANKVYEWLSRDPIELVSREDFSRVDELPGVGTDSVESFADHALAVAERIDSFLRSSESANLLPDEVLDLEIAGGYLRSQHLERMTLVDDSPRHSIKPSALINLLSSTPIYMDRDPRGSPEIVGGFISRLMALPHYLDCEIRRLNHPVDVWTSLEIESGEGFGEFARGVREFAKNSCNGGYGDISKFESVVSSAADAVKKYISLLKEMPKRQNLSIGPEATSQLLKYKGIMVSVDQIHQIANDHLVRTRDELEKIKLQIAEKNSLDPNLSLNDFGNALKDKYPGPSGDIIRYLTEISQKATEFAYESGLVERIKDKTIAEVRSTPAHLKPVIPIAAGYIPGLLGRGVRRSTFYATEFPGIEKSLNQLNSPTIAAHELFPGHGYQGSRAREHPSLIRGIVEAMDLLEGWTTRVAEDHMSELGWVGNPDLALEERYMSKTDQLRLGARVCFALTLLTGDRKYLNNSLGVMADDKNLLSAAKQLYKGITGFSDQRVKAEVEFFSSMGIYPTLYLVGNHLFRKMEREAKLKQGKDFTIPKFYEAVLQEGNMPLYYMEEALRRKGVLELESNEVVASEPMLHNSGGVCVNG